MHFTKEEKARFILIGARILIAVQQLSENPASFDNVLEVLKKLHQINEEWMILLSPHMHKISGDNFHILNFLAAGLQMKGLMKEVNDLVFSKNNREVMQTLLGDKLVRGVSAPVNISTILRMGRSHQNDINRFFAASNEPDYAGEVNTVHIVRYAIEFADAAKLEWELTNDQAELEKIRAQFDEKIQALQARQQLQPRH